MPKPPRPDRPAEGGRPGRPVRTGRGAPPRADRPGEGPPWKRRAEARAADDLKGKQAGWGGVARRGAGRLRDEGRASPASEVFRAASGSDWEPDIWVDEGEVRDEAAGAVGRGRGAPATRRRPGEPEETQPDPALAKAVGPGRADRMEAKLRDAGRAFRRERYAEARKILRPLASSVPSAASVRELLGVTYYRLGQWKAAIGELEAFRDLTGSTEQHPVLADCYRALGRHREVAELWEELREVSPSAALVAEGRIVYAGSLADRGQLREAIAVLEAARKPTKRPQDHHLRVSYALADLYERAGDVPRARQAFARVAAADPELGDVTARLRALR